MSTFIYNTVTRFLRERRGQLRGSFYPPAAAAAELEKEDFLDYYKNIYKKIKMQVIKLVNNFAILWFRFDFFSKSIEKSKNYPIINLRVIILPM